MKLQSILQDELLKVGEITKAQNVNGIIVDPFSGDILAMATVPSLDLNKYSSYSINIHRNRTVIDTYAPGSTFKIVALSGGFEEWLIRENDEYYCEYGRYRIHDLILIDHEPHEELTVREILMYSSARYTFLPG